MATHGLRLARVGVHDALCEPGSRFTALFEYLAIDWMQEAGQSATARQLGITWSEADGIIPLGLLL